VTRITLAVASESISERVTPGEPYPLVLKYSHLEQPTDRFHLSFFA